MKGLLIKDICLLKKQSNFFGLICVIAAIMLFANSDPQFVVCYLTTIFSLFTLSTFSYDEFDNGTAFLFTLPVSRKKYVTEKFLFGFILCLSTWCVTTIVAAIVTYVKNPNMVIGSWILTVAIYLILALVVLAITIPLQLKFGAEKSRIALFGVVGVAVLLVLGISKLTDVLGLDFGAILENLSTVGMAGLTGIAFVISAIIIVVSYITSIKIIEKKEY